MSAWTLVIEAEDGETVRVSLRRDRITIGRSDACMLRLTAMNVSRMHAVIERQGDAFFVEDTGSANGVRVNGRAVLERTPLHADDLLQIGDYHLVIRRELLATIG